MLLYICDEGLSTTLQEQRDEQRKNKNTNLELGLKKR